MLKRLFSSKYMGVVFLLLVSSILALPSVGAADNSPSKHKSMQMLFYPVAGKALLNDGEIQDVSVWQQRAQTIDTSNLVTIPTGEITAHPSGAIILSLLIVILTFYEKRKPREERM